MRPTPDPESSPSTWTSLYTELATWTKEDLIDRLVQQDVNEFETLFAPSPERVEQHQGYRTTHYRTLDHDLLVRLAYHRLKSFYTGQPRPYYVQGPDGRYHRYVESKEEEEEA